ncbi:unnamed protein product [Porites lobata]|uniref:Uncharacterized protein n=1 Tax=Porites lobata TaxID=104759 RepID=A0ABN8QTM2_9CNID|nr:unnamed protein product [Porites lobata]
MAGKHFDLDSKSRQQDIDAHQKPLRGAYHVQGNILVLLAKTQEVKEPDMDDETEYDLFKEVMTCKVENVKNG